MKSQKANSSLFLPNYDTSIQIGGDIIEFFDSLNRLGIVYIQARTDCGGLGKFVEATDIYYDTIENMICSPEGGWLSEMEELVAIHGTQITAGDTAHYSIDLEFAGRVCGLSLYIFPNVSNVDAYAELLAEFFGKTIPSEQLFAWREEMNPPLCMCGKCEEAGNLRAQFAKHHPCYEIFERLKENNHRAFVRFFSTHSDLTAWITADKLTVEQGIIMLSDSVSSDSLSLNMRFVHALKIKSARFNGAICSVLEIYNSRGHKAFQLVVENEELADEWQAICDDAS